MCSKADFAAEKKFVSPQSLAGDNSKMHLVILERLNL